MTLTPEQEADVLATAAQIVASRIEAAMVETLGGALGTAVVIPVGLAARLAGITSTHARRIMRVVQTEGSQDGVQFGDLIAAIEGRKNR
jgi:hypothetical protein